jgi:hypothetical protein
LPLRPDTLFDSAFCQSSTWWQVRREPVVFSGFHRRQISHDVMTKRFRKRLSNFRGLLPSSAKSLS